jgi:protein-tyrosine phosphatase
MFRVRAKLASGIERGALLCGWLGAGNPDYWRPGRRLVFVCSGNICRSPFAEVFARQRGIEAASCGTSTTSNQAANSAAVAEASHRGVDLSGHRTTAWLDFETRPDDVLVALQLKHALKLSGRARERSLPILLFSALLLPEFSVVEDPYGRSAQTFQEVFALIERGVDRIAGLTGAAAAASAGIALPASRTAV